MIAIMDPRLIPKRRPSEQMRLALDEQHTATARTKRERESGSIKSAADDDRCVAVRHWHDLTTSPRPAVSPGAE